MGPTSKELLHLEENHNISSLENRLFMLQEATHNFPKKENTTSSSSTGALITTAVPESQVLGKLKGFLETIDEANRKLQKDMQEKRHENFDIEMLTGQEDSYIEMDLALGVADLQTPEALAAAELALAGQKQISVPVVSDDSDSSSETEVTNDSDTSCEIKSNDYVHNDYETQVSDDGERFCETDDTVAVKSLQYRKSEVKRSATSRKGRKRPKIEIL